ncbi:MAG: beta-lactamase family protein [Verrucomicrobia bacterium]|nr:beta-lactamase family protein [Verrucomicrobiota bacterium]
MVIAPRQTPSNGRPIPALPTEHSLTMKLCLTILLIDALAIGALRAGSPLPVSSAERQGIDRVRLERMHTLISDHISQGKHAGAVAMVVRNGHIVDWHTWGKANLATGEPMRKDSIFRIYSMTKVLTAVATLQLFEANKLQLHQPITDILPELKGLKVFARGTADAPELVDIKTPITIRMLLNHTAGFTYDFFSGSPVHDLYKRQDLWNSASLDEFIGRVAKLPLISHPGETFQYGINNDVLGLIIQRVSGMSFEEYVSRNITGPLRMTDTSFDVPAGKLGRVATIHGLNPAGKLAPTEPILGAYAEPGQGIAAGGAGLFSTIGDYARFAQCLLNGGLLDGTRILGRKTLELALQNSLQKGVSAFAPSEGWGLISALRLDMAGALEPASEGMFYWSGAATTHFFVDPKEKLVGLVFCQHIPFDQHRLFTRFRTSIYQALK